jgi:hypothetical protein
MPFVVNGPLSARETELRSFPYGGSRALAERSKGGRQALTSAVNAKLTSSCYAIQSWPGEKRIERNATWRLLNRRTTTLRQPSETGLAPM